jgi:hypothetical protein
MADILLFDWRLDKAVQDSIKKKISDIFKGKMVEAPRSA